MVSCPSADQCFSFLIKNLNRMTVTSLHFHSPLSFIPLIKIIKFHTQWTCSVFKQLQRSLFPPLPQISVLRNMGQWVTNHIQPPPPTLRPVLPSLPPPRKNVSLGEGEIECARWSHEYQTGSAAPHCLCYLHQLC